MRFLCTAALVLMSSLLFGQVQTVPWGEPDHPEKGDHSESSGKAESASNPVRVFVLAGQSNMQGQGKIYDGATGAIGLVVDSFVPSCAGLGTETCEFTFNMMDGYGDGWNGWTYDFVQNGVVVASETLPNGTEGTAVVTLEDGVQCDVIVSFAGAYGPEISWTVTDPFGSVVASMDTQGENYPSPNTLLDVVENDQDEQWTMLQTNGEWTILDNAYLYFQNGQGTTIKDHVTIGQGAYPHLIGPELMFAHQLDEYYDDPVLIIKTAWGGLSLGEDFRPPSAGGTTGPYYTEMLDIVANVTENLATEFPELGAVGFEIMGFAWFQGWNDAGSQDFLDEYESNLYHLVNDVRNDLGNPNLPVVVASAGQGGYEIQWGWTQDIQEIVAVAQENVACNDTLYGGTVGFVDSKQYYLGALDSPDDAGYHYNNNALTFLNIGKAIGDEMILAINDMAYCDGFVSVSDDHQPSSELTLFPNPASSTLSMVCATCTGLNAVIRMYDLEGRVVAERPLGPTLQMDVSSLSRGLYVVEVTLDGQTVRQRVVLD
ncbi:MAG: T9SS type A sorting domain-containing protein [Flavobacteriales bacterium]|nr:T9SS type A sorting domain-containing protein [Flavobacteriales bacterium]